MRVKFTIIITLDLLVEWLETFQSLPSSFFHDFPSAIDIFNFLIYGFSQYTNFYRILHKAKSIKYRK